MELAKITNKGQITIPISIRKALNLKKGDKVAFVETEGQYVLISPTMLAIQKLQSEFEGAAEKSGLKDENDVVEMIKTFRKESNS